MRALILAFGVAAPLAVAGGASGGTPETGLAKTLARLDLHEYELAVPAPHLPLDFQDAHPGQTVHAVYRVCVGRDGKVFEVQPTMSLRGGADASVMQQIRDGWAYRPLPVAACFAKPFAFKIDGGVVVPSSPAHIRGSKRS